MGGWLGGPRKGAIPASLTSAWARESLKDALNSSLKREVLRNHTRYINTDHYSDPASPRGLPKATHSPATALNSLLPGT